MTGKNEIEVPWEYYDTKMCGNLLLVENYETRPAKLKSLLAWSVKTDTATFSFYRNT